MIRIGVIGSSNIAERRMIPAILKESSFEYAGVAISTKDEMDFTGTDEEFEPIRLHKIEKANRFKETFGGKVYNSYESLLTDKDVDAVYIALPPALHYQWAKIAINNKKHVILEKPFTVKRDLTEDLIDNAKKNDVAVIENYGFCYHKQMNIIKETIDNGIIGDIRLVRATFGFPHRDNKDFRYDKELGGGALLDAGGYTIKAATTILGLGLDVTSSSSIITEGHEVDMMGTTTLMRKDGVCAQLSYGMDNYYRCELEIWGSKGLVMAPRIFTAPDGFEAQVIIKDGQNTIEKTASDDQFQRIVSKYEECINSKTIRESIMNEIIIQSSLIEKVREINSENLD
ncbi:MAG: Gfo/Idh/MocA family oxidoreductase [Erysipelotrichaceae bacterium]|nr:Gfo/Idh/MocA family oxidoreductase [Erysipelotrichaceae bacterium]